MLVKGKHAALARLLVVVVPRRERHVADALVAKRAVDVDGEDAVARIGRHDGVEVDVEVPHAVGDLARRGVEVLVAVVDEHGR